MHILDHQTDEIIGTLDNKNAEYWGDTRKDSLNNENTFDFIANATLDKSSLLKKRNRLLIQDEDGFFREYIIFYARKYKRSEKDVRSNASFTDLAKAKVIEPQTLQGATSYTAVSTALLGTEWQPGNIEFTFIRTINIDDYTNPLALLKNIASTFELEISYRIEIYGNKVVGRYVDLRRQIAGFEGKEIVFGKDLIGIERIEDSSHIVTALLGIGPQKEDGTRLTVLVEDQEALQRWGRNGQHLIEVYEPESEDTEMNLDRLKTLTETALKKRIDAAVSYGCEAVSLEHIFGRSHEKIRVGQTVRIKDDGYKPPLYLEARIQEVIRAHSTKMIQSFKLGNFIEFKKSDLEAQITSLKNILSQKATMAALIQAIEQAERQAQQAENNAKEFAEVVAVEAEKNAKEHADIVSSEVEEKAKQHTDQVAVSVRQDLVDFTTEKITNLVIKSENIEAGAINEEKMKWATHLLF